MGQSVHSAKQSSSVRHEAPMSLGLLVVAAKLTLFQLVCWTEKKKMWELKWMQSLQGGPWGRVQLLGF